jgi:hypothetical protein
MKFWSIHWDIYWHVQIDSGSPISRIHSLIYFMYNWNEGWAEIEKPTETEVTAKVETEIGELVG